MRPFRKWTQWDYDIAMLVGVIVGFFVLMVAGHLIDTHVAMLRAYRAVTLPILLAVLVGGLYTIWRLGADRSQ